jgi:hypothetical protein
MPGGAAKPGVQRDADRVKLGMGQEEVGRLLGVPDETRLVPFGGQVLTGWIYRMEPKALQFWFDEGGKLRMKK